MAPKRHVHPEIQNMTLFGIRVFAYVVKVTISRSMTDVLIRERRGRFEIQREGHVNREAESRVMG